MAQRDAAGRGAGTPCVRLCTGPARPHTCLPGSPAAGSLLPGRDQSAAYLLLFPSLLSILSPPIHVPPASTAPSAAVDAAVARAAPRRAALSAPQAVSARRTALPPLLWLAGLLHALGSAAVPERPVLGQRPSVADGLDALRLARPVSNPVFL